MRTEWERDQLKRLLAEGKSFEFIAEFITGKRTPGPKGYVVTKSPGGVAWDAFNQGLITKPQLDDWYLRRGRAKARARSKNRERFRREVLERDGHKCVVCGATTDLEVDHIVDFHSVMVNESSNGITLCRACHKKKTHPARFTSFHGYDELARRGMERRMENEHAFARKYGQAVGRLGYTTSYAFCNQCNGHHLSTKRIDRNP